jgi:hypothetical protein
MGIQVSDKYMDNFEREKIIPDATERGAGLTAQGRAVHRILRRYRVRKKSVWRKERGAPQEDRIKTTATEASAGQVIRSGAVLRILWVSIALIIEAFCSFIFSFTVARKEKHYPEVRRILENIRQAATLKP